MVSEDIKFYVGPRVARGSSLTSKRVMQLSGVADVTLVAIDGASATNETGEVQNTPFWSDEALPLEESQALLDDIDAIIDALPAPSLKPEKDRALTTASYSASVTSDTKQTRSKVPTRVRQRQELDYLRTQVVELETQLEQLKRAQPQTAGIKPGSVWESIAKRQLDEKQRVEIENIKLREMLEGQLRVARSLEKLLNKRSYSTAEILFNPAKRPRVTQMEAAGTVFDQLHRELPLRFAELDGVMASSGLSLVHKELDDVEMTLDVDNEFYMERKLVQVMPFPFRQTFEAAWQCFSIDHLELNGGYFGTTRRTNNSCDVEFCVKSRVRRISALIHVKGAGERRLSPDGRGLVVWHSRGLLEGAGFSEKTVGFRERGYISIEPLDPTHAPSSLGVPTSIMKTSLRVYPEIEDMETTQTGLFVDLVLSSFNENIKTMIQVIENSLLEQSLRSKSH